MHAKLITLFTLVISFTQSSATQNVTVLFKNLNQFRECLNNNHPIVCIKERALDAINETMMNDSPLDFYGVLQIERNPEYRPNLTDEENLPEEISQRSIKLTDILYDRIEDFFKSRTLKVNLAPAFEGRKKSGKGGKGGMMMLGMIGMGCMIAQMMMGKIAFLAGSALIIAKVALFLSAIAGFKKMSGGGGGSSETAHVVYATGGSDYGHSHGGGGGGWHRSLDPDSQIAYSTQISENAINGY